eukprot:TRINITY_DN5477_c0_g1_i1.p1 TRINITY_DN5477_c0_g1~~TRINITY_DN5477_c0_g1_i1.p1  ORF type:complete len:278 (+),score=66.15 TRINITY_DN5477_c0_g1_i1:129-962(+)
MIQKQHEADRQAQNPRDPTPMSQHKMPRWRMDHQLDRESWRQGDIDHNAICFEDYDTSLLSTLTCPHTLLNQSFQRIQWNVSKKGLTLEKRSSKLRDPSWRSSSLSFKCTRFHWKTKSKNRTPFFHNRPSTRSSSTLKKSRMSARPSYPNSVQKKSEESEEIAKVIIDTAHLMEAYITYVRGFDESLKAYTAAKHKPKFQEFELECEKDARTHFLILADFLVMPVQRVPRLELLFKELKNATSEVDPGRDAIERAYSALEAVGKKINAKEAVSKEDN